MAVACRARLSISAREAVFAELAWIIRAGGSVYVADLTLRQLGPAAEVCSMDDNWFA